MNDLPRQFDLFDSTEKKRTGNHFFRFNTFVKDVRLPGSTC